jgi:hypothetical protein
MFNKYTVKQLRDLISKYSKSHTIPNYSKMKKADLISLLEKRFVIYNNVLHEKPIHYPSKPIDIKPMVNESKGYKTYMSAVNKVERQHKQREEMKKHVAFAKRIRGNFA